MRIANWTDMDCPITRVCEVIVSSQYPERIFLYLFAISDANFYEFSLKSDWLDSIINDGSLTNLAITLIRSLNHAGGCGSLISSISQSTLKKMS